MQEDSEVKWRGHTWYELIYRQCLLQLIRNTSGPGSSSSSVRGLTMGSLLDLVDFLDFFFLFFFIVVVVSPASGRVSSSRVPVGGTRVRYSFLQNDGG